ncbi:hypothetical protein JHK85_048690 [Glycine max]|nr:hypothetical protein JHK85_048690 [Glycine max]
MSSQQQQSHLVLSSGKDDLGALSMLEDNEVCVEIYKGVTTSQLNELVAETTAAMIANHPDYSSSSYPSKSSFYKFGLSEPENTSHYRYGHDYEVNHHEPVVDEYRRPSENSLTINEKSAARGTKPLKYVEDLKKALVVAISVVSILHLILK